MMVVLVPENQPFYTHVRDICSRSPGPVAESLVWETPTPGEVQSHQSHLFSDGHK